MARDYGQQDHWRTIDQVDLERIRPLAARLELRGRHADEVAARSAYLDLLAIMPGERVLDVGCGSGVVLRDLARRVGPDGRAVGLEYGAAFLPIVRELAERDGLAERIELHQGDARALPFADGEFDLALAATVLRHIPDGDLAVAELARVVRPGGRVAVFEGDTDGCLINHPDRVLTRRIVASGTDNNNVDGQLARRVPGLLHEAGLEDIQVRAFTTVDRDPEGYYSQRCVTGRKPQPGLGRSAPRKATGGSKRSWRSRPPAAISWRRYRSSPGDAGPARQIRSNRAQGSRARLVRRAALPAEGLRWTARTRANG